MIKSLDRVVLSTIKPRHLVAANSFFTPLSMPNFLFLIKLVFPCMRFLDLKPLNQKLDQLPMTLQTPR